MNHRIYYICIVCVLHSIVVYSQNSITDSIHTIKKTDSISLGELEITMDDRMNQLLQLSDTIDRPPPNPDTTKTRIEFCRKHPKLRGYTIRVFGSTTKENFESLRKEFTKEFPELRVESTYISPEFVLLSGEYFHEKDAEQDAILIKKKYPMAIVRRTYISCIIAKGDPFQ